MSGQRTNSIPLASMVTNMNWINRKLACSTCGQPLFPPHPDDAVPGQPVDYNYLTQQQMAFAGLVCANLNCPCYLLRFLNTPEGEEDNKSSSAAQK